MVAISRTSLASNFGLSAEALAGFAEAELILLIRCAAFVFQWRPVGASLRLDDPANQSGQALDIPKTPAIDFLTTL
jgi:hypothetical protein